MSRRFLSAAAVLGLIATAAVSPVTSAGATPAASSRPAPRSAPATPVPDDGVSVDPTTATPQTASTAVPASTRTTGVTKVLVILAYWSSHDSTTAAKAKSSVITNPNVWYRNASYGRLGLSGSATNWVKVPTFSCGDFRIVAAAKAAAARAGYNTAGYNRYVVYEPCKDASYLGLGQIGGNEVLLFSGGMSGLVAVHEQGHNYGLDHSNYLQCIKNGGRVTFAAGSTCKIVEYADPTSDMGDITSGDFSAPQKTQLGWLAGKLYTVTHSQTVTLGAYETTAGYKAFRIAGTNHRTYWVEYRTRRGNDAHLNSGLLGVIVHMTEPQPSGQPSSKALLLDMVPLGATAASELSPYLHLGIRPGGNWTSPEGLRFHVVSQTSTAVKIQITSHQQGRLAGPVTSVHAYANDKSVNLSFLRGFDGGSPVWSYQVTAQPSNKTYTLTDVSNGAAAHLKFPGLTNGTKYTFTIRAINEHGRGTAVTSPAVTPYAHPPAAPTITSPKTGMTLAGAFHIYVSAPVNSTSKSPINCVYIHVVTAGGKDGGCDTVAPFVFLVNKGDFGKGTWTIEARSHDANGNWSAFSKPIKFTVP